MKLTKAQRDLLWLATKLGGTIRVFSDQRADVLKLAIDGLFVRNGKYLDQTATITPAGRAALAEKDKANER